MTINPSETLFTDAYFFLFANDELLIKQTDGITSIPHASDVEAFSKQPTNLLSIGIFEGRDCFIGTISNENIPTDFSFTQIRPIYGTIEDNLFWSTCRAFHLFKWLKTTKFCGCCAGTMQLLPQELGFKCSLCGHLIYPRISPAIIVAVTNANQLLLAHGKNFPPNRYSVVAGFVEPGETLEECVQRELKEEVGIEVKNIKYFGSQPWSFPDSLMMAFTAECTSEKITIDNKEITAAGWFSIDNLPNIPDKPTIGRQLIDWFIKKNTPSKII